MEELTAYRLSPQQKKSINQQRQTEQNHAQIAIKISGILDINILKLAIANIIQDDSVYKTTFIKIDHADAPVQVLGDNGDFLFFYSTEEAFQPTWGSIMHYAADQIFDLEKGPLMRVDLSGQEDFYVLIITVPALCCDFYGLGVLADLIKSNYVNLWDKNIEPSNETIPYIQFSEWQNQLLEDEDYVTGADYWDKKKLFTHKGNISFDKDPLQLESFDSKVLTDSCPIPDISSFKFENQSIEHFLGFCWQYLIWYFSQNQSIVVGCINNCRDFEELNQTQGILSKCLPVFVEFSDTKRISECFFEYLQLMETHDEYKMFFEHSKSEIINYQLYDFTYEFSDLTSIFKDDNILEFEIIRRSLASEALKINLICEQDHLNLRLNFQYNGSSFDEEDVILICELFKSLIFSFTSEPNIYVKDVNPIPVSQLEAMIDKFNISDEVIECGSKTVDMLFDQQVLNFPESIALVVGHKKITYRELDQKVNAVASYLSNTICILPGDVVALVSDSNENMIIGMLGVLKTGAAYVPIDPLNPMERSKFILNDSGAKALLTEDCFYQQYAGYMEHVICLDKLDDLAVSFEKKLRKTDSPLYIIYTSGTTGLPKGVIIPDLGLINYILWLQNTFSISPNDSSILLSSYAFDLGYTSIWGTLLTGGCLHLLPGKSIKEPETIVKYIVEYEITFIKTTPSLFSTIVYSSNVIDLSGSNLRLVIMGGEPVKVHDLERFVQIMPDIELINHYGPTESTIGTIATVIDKNKLKRYRIHPVIGKPILNSFISILDDSGHLVPPGITGELCISGNGLALGYLNRDELTSKSFVKHPYKNIRMYRSGDLACWMPDGNILFSGRKDSQVKIRGFRVELAEIQYALMKFDGIRRVEVIAVDSELFGKELAAYYESELFISHDDLRECLRSTLPEAFIPSYFIKLDVIPLTGNGKFDKSELPDPRLVASNLLVSYLEPTNELESRMLKLWKQVLGIDKISIRDNFFDLGGHSLKAIQLASQIHKEFEIRIDISKIFANPTIESLSLILLGLNATQFKKIPVIKLQDSYVCSSAQRRLWILSQLEEGSLAYNVPSAQIFEGELDTESLSRSFAALILRHESLRTVFRESEGEVRQYILSPDELGFSVGFQDVSSLDEDTVAGLVQEEISKAFDLSRGPLLRAKLYQVSAERWVFTYVMHHIISDGWSRTVLIRELLDYYHQYLEGKEVSVVPLSIQYKDYAQWQQKQLTGDQLEAHRSYWQEQFSGVLPVLELAGDHIRPAVKTYNGSSVQGILPAALSNDLKRLLKETGTTLFMGLLAAVNALLYRYTGQEDMIIGSPIAGREHAELEDQIGFYVNTLALRARFSGDDSYRDLLGNIRELTLGAYSHQAYPFDELVEQLDLKRDMSRSALFDVMVVLQNNERLEGQEQDFKGLQMSGYQGGENLTSKFDLTFSFKELEEGIYYEIEYNTDIYEQDRILRLSGHFEQLLSGLLENPGVAVSRISYLGEAERELLLGFNATAQASLPDCTVLDLFEEQVLLSPSAVAVVFEERSLSYGELNALSNQLAHYLRSAYAIQADDLIGLMVERSDYLLIGILGILKSGGAYVPIDADYPQDRVDYLLGDSNCRLLLGLPELLSAIESSVHSRENLGIHRDAGSLAYVMYTSGSTGQPKGVMIEHRSIVRLVYRPNYITFSASDVLLSTGAVSFDATTFEYWGMLVNGGCLVLCSQDDLLNVSAVVSLISEHKVSVMWFTSGWLNQLVESDVSLFGGLSRIIAGGDKLSADHINVLQEKYPSLEILNGYGPTENTTFTLTYAIKGLQGANIPIGRPVSQSQVYIVDGELNLQPLGVAGEICIAGAGLARGYLNHDELTLEKFVANPFVAGERMYRSGDLGRWDASGNIEFLGRMDEQVKVRGYRIEPGEIEHALQGYEEVISAVVLARNVGNSGKELVAYLVGSPELNVSAIRDYLSGVLPSYMIPGHYVQLDALPLTANGKIDRAALPSPEGSLLNVGSLYEAARDETEAKLVRIWEELLGRERIGIHDNFFELGGHSLKITRLVSQIHKEFEVKVLLLDLFKNPTIIAIAKIINMQLWLKQENHLLPQSINDETQIF